MDFEGGNHWINADYLVAMLRSFKFHHGERAKFLINGDSPWVIYIATGDKFHLPKRHIGITG